jgi:hypothetical protein
MSAAYLRFRVTKLTSHFSVERSPASVGLCEPTTVSSAARLPSMQRPIASALGQGPGATPAAEGTARRRTAARSNHWAGDVFGVTSAKNCPLSARSLSLMLAPSSTSIAFPKNAGSPRSSTIRSAPLEMDAAVARLRSSKWSRFMVASCASRPRTGRSRRQVRRHRLQPVRAGRELGGVERRRHVVERRDARRRARGMSNVAVRAPSESSSGVMVLAPPCFMPRRLGSPSTTRKASPSSQARGRS